MGGAGGGKGGVVASKCIIRCSMAIIVDSWVDPPNRGEYCDVDGQLAILSKPSGGGMGKPFDDIHG